MPILEFFSDFGQPSFSFAKQKMFDPQIETKDDGLGFVKGL